MPLNWEIYKKAYDAADQNTKDLMSSSRIYDCMAPKLGEKLATIQTSSVVLIIGYYLLKINPLEKTLEELSALGVPDVYNFLNAVVREVTVPTIPTSVPEETPERVVDPELEAEIAATEHTLESLPGLRTMAGDMKAIHPQEEPVYHSSQETILQRPTIPPPAPPQSSGPRWDTG
jgi:hypothetical protein